MLKYLIRRLFWAFGVFIAVTIVLYVMFFRLPVDPARAYAGGDGASVEEVQRAAKFLGTDDPVWQQYVHFLGRVTIDHSLGRRSRAGGTSTRSSRRRFRSPPRS